MDFSPLLHGVATLATASIAACTPIITYKVTRWLHVDVTDKQMASFNDSIETALGKALAYGQAAGDAALSNVTIKNAALNSALSFALADAPAEIKALGYSAADVAEILAGRLAKALHVSLPAVPSATTDTGKTAAMMEKADATMADPVLPVADAAAPVAA